jgi:MerR family redox-sensitive transcriptional activator SoxR
VRIGELAQRAETPPTTIRYYESLGLLRAPRRHAGRRVYGDDDVPRLRAIAALQYAGFTLAEIGGLVHLLAPGQAPGPAWQRAAGAKLEELDAAIAELARARTSLSQAIDCSCRGNPDACAFVSRARPTPARRRRRR